MSLLHRRRMVLAGVFALLIALTGCPGMQGDGDGNGPAATVRIANIAFNPASVTIRVGEMVRWVNEDNMLHSATSGNPGDPDEGTLFDSGTLDTGDSFSHTFQQVGTFTYHCEFHPIDMRDATVIVLP